MDLDGNFSVALLAVCQLVASDFFGYFLSVFFRLGAWLLCRILHLHWCGKFLTMFGPFFGHWSLGRVIGSITLPCALVHTIVFFLHSVGVDRFLFRCLRCYATVDGGLCWLY